VVVVGELEDTHYVIVFQLITPLRKNGVSKIMTDKELLELAAKAAGIIDGHWLGDCFWVGAYDGGYEWNPLTDDGDALRLAVKLELTIGKPFEHKIALVWLDDITSFAGNSEKEGGIYAATRRAIVRAAAKIGKEIK